MRKAMTAWLKWAGPAPSRRGWRYARFFGCTGLLSLLGGAQAQNDGVVAASIASARDVLSLRCALPRDAFGVITVHNISFSENLKALADKSGAPGYGWDLDVYQEGKMRTFMGQYFVEFLKFTPKGVEFGSYKTNNRRSTGEVFDSNYVDRQTLEFHLGYDSFDDVIQCTKAN